MLNYSRAPRCSHRIPRSIQSQPVRRIKRREAEEEEERENKKTMWGREGKEEEEEHTQKCTFLVLSKNGFGSDFLLSPSHP